MKGKRNRGWTVLFVRQDGTETHSLRLGVTRWILIATLVLVACAAVGFLAGRQWQQGAAAGRMAELRGEVERLEAEQTRVAELTARLESVERGYRRLRRAVAGDASTEGRDLVLPPAVAGTRALGPSGDSELDAARPSAWPLAQRGFLTRSFGSRTDASEAGHPGLDIAIAQGSYVRASGAGVVAEAGDDPVYGLHLRIAHGNGLSSLYAHNSWLFVAVGDSVERLQVLALSGNTGQSTAPHLHFAIEEDGRVVDPLAFMPMGR